MKNGSPRSLLEKVRQERNDRVRQAPTPMIFPFANTLGYGSVSASPSPLDDMVELYFQARYEDELAAMKAGAEEAVEKAKKAQDDLRRVRVDLEAKAIEARENGNQVRREAGALKKLLERLLDVGVELATWSHDDSNGRIKITKVVAGDEISYVSWDKRRKRWQKKPQKATIASLVLSGFVFPVRKEG